MEIRQYTARLTTAELIDWMKRGSIVDPDRHYILTVKQNNSKEIFTSIKIGLEPKKGCNDGE